jgi:hypothetical protein
LGADPIEATELGMKNIQRVALYLVDACCKPGEDYDLLRNMYSQLLSQRSRELSHVTGMIGGYEQINLYFGDADRVYHPIPADKQREALKFLLAYAFQTPAELVDPAITLRLEAGGAADRILTSQTTILRSLLSETRFKRMAEQAQRVKAGEPTYAPWEMMANLRSGIWSELDQERVAIDLYRRNLQRAHVATLAGLLDSGSDSDLAAVSRSELTALKDQIQKKVESADPVAQVHLQAVLAEIARAFDPASRPAAPAAPTSPFPRTIPTP